MISQLSGTVAQISGTWVVLDVNGFGMKAFCSPNTSANLHLGNPTTLFTSLILRQDAVTLYGFATAEERDCFELVQSASGIGPKIALAVVSVLGPAELRTAIAQANLATLTKVPGIGNKGAGRLIIELKDKIGLIAGMSNQSQSGESGWQQQVKSGLEGLGYSAKDAESAVDSITALAEADPPVGLSQLMRAALRSLAK